VSAPLGRVAKNSALRAGGYTLGAAMFFVAVIVIGRHLGVEDFGHYSFIVALVGVFQSMADMGVRNVFIRDVAVEPESVRARLGVARTLLVALSLVSLAGISALAFLLSLPREVRLAMCLAGVASMVTFSALGYSAVLRAFERMDVDIFGFVAHKALFLVLMLAVARARLGLLGVFGGLLLANLGLYAYYRALVERHHGRSRLSLDFRAALRLLTESFPLGTAEVLRRLLWQADRLVLTALSSAGAVGLFSAAYKFLEAAQPLAQNITLPLFPGFSRMARTDPERLRVSCERSLRLLFVISVPGAVILGLLAERILVTVWGRQYMAAAPALAVMAPVAALLLPTSLFAYFFTALERQRLYALSVAAGLGVKLVLGGLLVPGLAHVGAGIASLAAETTVLATGLLLLRRLGVRRTGVMQLHRPLLAALPLAGLCWVTRGLSLWWLLAGALLGVACYGLLLPLLGGVTRDDLGWLRGGRRAAAGDGEGP
jgi:O-antigen/teichoic acid export membrane protein